MIRHKLLEHVSASGSSIELSNDEIFYQTVKDAFAIVAMSDPALYSNIVFTNGTKGV